MTETTDTMAKADSDIGNVSPKCISQRGQNPYEVFFRLQKNRRYFDHSIAKFIMFFCKVSNHEKDLHSTETFPLFCFDLERLIRILFPG